MALTPKTTDLVRALRAAIDSLRSAAGGAQLQLVPTLARCIECSEQGRVQECAAVLRSTLGELQSPAVVATDASLEAIARALRLCLALPEGDAETETTGGARELPGEHVVPSAPTAAVAAPSNRPLFEVALGAHSATNFYVTLESESVVQSGGVFVETYRLPEVGSKVDLAFELPGGFAFEAIGEVLWQRHPRTSTACAPVPPGFGARLFHISEEGGRLIERYVRNREPLLHGEF